MVAGRIADTDLELVHHGGHERAGLLQLIHLIARGVHLQIEVAALPAELDRLVDDGDGRARLHQIEQQRDVLGIHAHASPADPASDAPGGVGAVDQIAALSDADGVAAQRVVGPGRHHAGQLGVFGAGRPTPIGHDRTGPPSGAK